MADADKIWTSRADADKICFDGRPKVHSIGGSRTEGDDHGEQQRASLPYASCCMIQHSRQIWILAQETPISYIQYLSWNLIYFKYLDEKVLNLRSLYFQILITTFSERWVNKACRSLLYLFFCWLHSVWRIEYIYQGWGDVYLVRFLLRAWRWSWNWSCRWCLNYCSPIFCSINE
jgi:hypothetical protein